MYNVQMCIHNPVSNRFSRFIMHNKLLNCFVSDKYLWQTYNKWYSETQHLVYEFMIYLEFKQWFFVSKKNIKRSLTSMKVE